MALAFHSSSNPIYIFQLAFIQPGSDVSANLDVTKLIKLEFWAVWTCGVNPSLNLKRACHVLPKISQSNHKTEWGCLLTFMVVLDDPQAFGGLQGLHGLQENLATSNVLYGLPHISLLILEQLEKLKCSSYTASEELYLSCKIKHKERGFNCE